MSTPTQPRTEATAPRGGETPAQPRAPGEGPGYGKAYGLPGLAALFLAAGIAVRLGAAPAEWSHRIWLAGLLVTGAPVVWGTLRGAVRGVFAADLVATLAIVAAVALLNPLPGLVVVLMQTGGEALERYAQGRASRAVRELVEAAPRTAHRVGEDGTEDVSVDVVEPGDVLLVRPGELVPTDGEVVDGRSHVDASRLTGEPLPVLAEAGVQLMSGSVNGEGAFRLRATAPAAESQYARIVELVRTAQASKAPIQRVADRYAVWFTPLTLLVCAAAWLASGDATRVLAVLVVATPCPLILATPVAIIGGISRSARRHIIIRQGGALERLAGIRTAVFDKTGTLTVGMPRVARVLTAPGWDDDEVLRLAAAVEHGSGHLLARTVVDAARERGIPLPPAEEVVEEPGSGVVGTVEGRRVRVGSRRYVAGNEATAAEGLAELDAREEGLRALVAVDGEAAGLVEFADRLRPNLPDLLAELRRLGVRRTVLLSGDHERHARAVAAALGIEEAEGDLLPEDKVTAVRRLVAAGEPTLMVGDGTNDAPALSAATVGIALAGHGGGITAEAADVVILIDEPARVAEVIGIARRTMRIARQSIIVGLGLSGVAMVFAALGHIPPTAGALLQEAIDIAVILNALRASA